MRKILIKRTVVVLGDRLTHVIWEKIPNTLLAPFLDLTIVYESETENEPDTISARVSEPDKKTVVIVYGEPFLDANELRTLFQDSTLSPDLIVEKSPTLQAFFSWTSALKL